MKQQMVIAWCRGCQQSLSVLAVDDGFEGARPVSYALPMPHPRSRIVFGRYPKAVGPRRAVIAFS